MPTAKVESQITHRTSPPSACVGPEEQHALLYSVDLMGLLRYLVTGPLERPHTWAITAANASPTAVLRISQDLCAHLFSLNL